MNFKQNSGRIFFIRIPFLFPGGVGADGEFDDVIRVNLILRDGQTHPLGQVETGKI